MIYYEPRIIFDLAIIRIESNVVVYSLSKLTELIMKEDKCSFDEALEHISYNFVNQGLDNWPIIENDFDAK
jgi:hypothetical protein